MQAYCHLRIRCGQGSRNLEGCDHVQLRDETTLRRPTARATVSPTQSPHHQAVPSVPRTVRRQGDRTYGPTEGRMTAPNFAKK